MRILGVTGSHRPGIASQIGILIISLQGSVLGVLPESLQPIECGLLNGAVVGIRRARTAIPDDRSWVRRIRRVGIESSSRGDRQRDRTSACWSNFILRSSIRSATTPLRWPLTVILAQASLEHIDDDVQ